jgi:hypothetical protein
VMNTRMRFDPGGFEQRAVQLFFNFEIAPILTSRMHPPPVIVHEN